MRCCRPGCKQKQKPKGAKKAEVSVRSEDQTLLLKEFEPGLPFSGDECSEASARGNDIIAIHLDQSGKLKNSPQNRTVKNTLYYHSMNFNSKVTVVVFALT